MLLTALGLTAIGAAVSLGSDTHETRRVTFRMPVLPKVEPVVTPIVEKPVAIAQPVRSMELGLVFSAGGATYMRLTEVGDGRDVAMPKHGKLRLHSADGVESAIATVRDSDVPIGYRRWQDRDVIVDNNCRTTVTGFAVVARLTGDTGYAGIEASKWTAKTVFDSGAKVLAAKLADCDGTFARDAALPAVVVPDSIEDETLASRARAALIASEAAHDTQSEYTKFYAEYDADGEAHGNWWDEKYVNFDTRVVRHPTTGVTWVSIHGSLDHSCGDPTVNVWGLFRVETDGTLAPVQLRKLDDLWEIDQLVDIDNDGELELIGKPWLGLDTVVVRANSEELSRLELPFFGCPC